MTARASAAILTGFLTAACAGMTPGDAGSESSDTAGEAGETEGETGADWSLTEVGPPFGTLMAVGGGGGSLHFARFIELCGGGDASIVVVPTAQADENVDPGDLQTFYSDNWALSNVTILHTRDPAVADDPEFHAPVQQADCVWFVGGQHWRLADAYLDTATLDAFVRVLDRGGAIGGTSAGASILASFLVRGDEDSSAIVIGDHRVGFGFLRGVGIDQHVTERMREYDLITLLEYDMSLLGIGIDEDTWIEVTEDELRVDGVGQVFIHDVENWPVAPSDPEEQVLRLNPGQRYDMASRALVGG
jgi:cyanophycinase